MVQPIHKNIGKIIYNLKKNPWKESLNRTTNYLKLKQPANFLDLDIKMHLIRTHPHIVLVTKNVNFVAICLKNDTAIVYKLLPVTLTRSESLP